MCATLIGGMDRLRSQYIQAAKERGWELRCLSKNVRDFSDKIGNPDALIVFTNKVSHEAKRKAVEHARSRDIPLHLIHSCGLSTLRDCLDS